MTTDDCRLCGQRHGRDEEGDQEACPSTRKPTEDDESGTCSPPNGYDLTEEES